MAISFGISLLGFVILLVRLKPWKKSLILQSSMQDAPFVSIIVPCRNEEKRLAPTLRSLSTLDYPSYEIIIVDDHSTDKTVEVALRYDVRLVSNPTKPKAWSGKNWACWNGAIRAQGEYLLFTDADTIHNPDSLTKALQFVRSRNLDLISAPPFHLCQNWYEKILGLFHLLPLIATGYLKTPKADRLYAIGQYLLWNKNSYFGLGGHSAIAESLVDDIDLAVLTVKNNKRYQVYPQAELYSVQMFSNFNEFLKGWTRLIRLGLKRTSVLSFLEVVLVMHLFLAPLFNMTALNLMLLSFTMILLERSQRRHGQVWFGSSILAFVSLVLWCGLSVIAVVESVLRMQIQWRDRNYQVG